VVAPTQPSDYRPISITPILTRVMERMVVTQYIYPSLLAPPAALIFTNQFAFRPTGSTTAAIITILDHVTGMLVDNPYVIVIAIDFTKASDTVRQAALVEKLALLNIPDNIYNWLRNFFTHRVHCTVFQGHTSARQQITASIVQDSAVGPVSYKSPNFSIKSLSLTLDGGMHIILRRIYEITDWLLPTNFEADRPFTARSAASGPLTYIPNLSPRT
jgi:hypothetical protein